MRTNLEIAVQPLGTMLALVIVAALLGRAFFMRRRQRRLLCALTDQHRLNYAHEDLIGIQQRYQNLQLLRRGHSRHACHLFYGTDEAGLVTMFCFTCELGFGINRADRQWWIAVLETARPHEPWRAAAGGNVMAAADSSALAAGTKFDRHTLTAPHRATAGRLLEAGIKSLFAAAPDDYEWEVQGPLIAVATPFRIDPAACRQLLETACRLARLLAENNL